MALRETQIMRRRAARKLVISGKLSADNALSNTRASGGMVDALASGASALRGVEVQVLSRVPKKKDSSILSFFFGTP